MPAVVPVRMSSLVWLVATLSVLAALSSRDLWSPDEPRYGRVAREMLDSGDGLVLRLNGDPYAEKPPLLYWCMAATGWICGGLGPVGARLPAALFAALAVLWTARVARRWFADPALADTAAVLFGTTYLVLWNGSRAALDLPMTAFTLLAVDAGSRFVARGSWTSVLAFGAALGGGVLAKGPHALYVPVCALVGGCVAAGAARRLRDPRWLAGLAVAAAVVAAWLVPALEAGGPEYRDRLLGQIGKRVGGEGEPHLQSPAYFLYLLPALALPWTPFGIAGAVAAVRTLLLRPSAAATPSPDDPGPDRFGLGASLAAVAVPLVLLSVPASKRDIYLLPLLPPAACLAAWILHRPEVAARLVLRRAIPASMRGVALLCAALAAGAFLTPLFAPSLWPPDADDRVSGNTFASGGVPFALGAVGTLCAAGAIAGFALAERAAAGVRAVAIALGAAWVVAALAVLPAFDATKSWREAAAVAQVHHPEAPLAIAGFSDESLLWAFDRGGGRRVVEVNGPEQIAALLDARAPRALLVAKEKHWEQAIDWAEDHGLDATLPTLRSATLLWRGRLGRTVYTLHTNAGP